MKTPKIAFLIPLFFLLVVLIPVVFLLFGSFFFEVGAASLTFENIKKIFLSWDTYVLLGNTLQYAVGGALLATVLGAIYAWIVVRTDVPCKRLLSLIVILPLAMPLFVKAFAWMYLFSPRIGIFNLIAQSVLGSNVSLFNIYSIGGLIFALGLGGLPLAYLAIEPAVKSLDPALEESSRVAGNGILKTLRKITIPVLLPAIFAAFLLSTILGMENFDYPFILGQPGGISTLPTEVYFYVFNRLPPQYGTASIISFIYLALTFSAVSIYIWYTRKTYKFVVVTGKATQKTVHKLRKWRYPAFGVCFLIMFFAFILPFSTLVLMSFTTFLTIGAAGSYVINLTLQNYVNALTMPLIWTAFTNTILLALITGISATIIALFMSYAALKTKTKGARLIEYISSIPLAFPGIVYGLALFWTFLLLPGANLLYGTIWPLAIALIVIRFPNCVRIISSNLMQISNEMEEASRVAGASWLRTMIKVVFPLLGGGIANSFLYTFVNSIRELGAIVLLYTSGSIVISTLLLTLFTEHALALNTVAAASVLITVFVMMVLAMPWTYKRVSRFMSKRLHERKATESLKEKEMQIN